MRKEAQTGQRGELTLEAAGSLGSGEARVPHNGISSSDSESQHLMSERLKIEIASDTAPVFLPHCFIRAFLKIVLILSCSAREGKKSPNACHPSSFYVSFILTEQQASTLVAGSGVSLGQVEPAYGALFGPMLLQKTNALC